MALFALTLFPIRSTSAAAETSTNGLWIMVRVIGFECSMKVLQRVLMKGFKNPISCNSSTGLVCEDFYCLVFTNKLY